MVALDIVQASNARIGQLGPGLVALFVGGTSGIGEFTLRAFVKHAISPRVYLVGRNAAAAEEIIKDCEALNKESKVEFLKADVSELSEVDRVCKDIQKKEKTINLLVQTQGNLNLRGRDESPEGLDRKFTLNFYSRMRFISNLLPMLRNASTSPPQFARSVSILSAGHGNKINLDDIELKKTFTGARCAAHTCVMNDLMAEEFAARDSRITFIHAFPGVVNTGAARELPIWARAPLKLIMPLMSPFLVPREECGERQLFHATSGMFPPANPSGESRVAGGVPLAPGISVGTGVDGKPGSGGYLLNWNGEITGKSSFLSDYKQDIGKVVWEHTFGIFQRVEKINQDRVNS